MPRQLSNWLDSYVQYASISEAPKIYHFWAGVSAIAGALRRHVWFDQVKFKWFPNFYIVFVAPPGIATKSTTADGSIDLLREVPGIKFGPDEVTWQSLVTSFAEAAEAFPFGDTYIPQSAITILASEFGMYMDFRDTKMVNLHITLWDGRVRFDKQTKTSGKDMVDSPWINLLACTTPQWISSNMDENTIGGGFTSRCVFVYGDQKEKLVAYLKNQAKFDYGQLRSDLIHDLEWISLNLVGPYELEEEAETWGELWYQKLWNKVWSVDNEDWVNNYIARKQAHLHKLAMVIAASQRDELVLKLEDLLLADEMLSLTEKSAHRVFAKVGKGEEAQQSERILEIIEKKKELSFKELYRLGQLYFPNARDFDGIVKSFLNAGQIVMYSAEGVPMIRFVPPPTSESPPA